MELTYLEVMGILFHASILICALVLIVSTTRAIKDKNLRIYREALKDREKRLESSITEVANNVRVIDYESEAIKSEIDTRFLGHLDKLGQ